MFCPIQLLPWQMNVKATGAVFGQELEIFSQKSGIIQSGLNTMQTVFVLELEFASTNVQVNTLQENPNGGSESVTWVENRVLWKSPAGTYANGDTCELRAYIMHEKLIAFNNTNGSVRAKY